MVILPQLWVNSTKRPLKMTWDVALGTEGGSLLLTQASKLALCLWLGKGQGSGHCGGGEARPQSTVAKVGAFPDTGRTSGKMSVATGERVVSGVCVRGPERRGQGNTAWTSNP